MVFEGDPYRTLGLARGATLDEVKRAYRRLAKANHPDAAGAAALERFLAIQAAYEHLAGGLSRQGAKTRGPGSASTRPDAADPDRAEATRRAYGGRPRGRRSASDGGPERPAASGHAPADAPGGAAGGWPGERGSTRSARQAGAESAARDGPRGKATLGSTSYDGADAGPFEPDWGGASWYGTSSGTYWTINPKEYADPRKHGPEYQARARRAASGRQGAGATASVADGTTPPESPDEAPPEAPAASATAEDRRGRRESPGHGDPPSAPAHTTASWWNPTAGPTEAPGERAGWTTAHRPVHETPYPDGSVADPARAAIELVGALTDPRSGGFRGRIVRAFIGWLPIAFGLGWLFGELTGCGRFAATCDASANPLVLGVQGAALIALLLLPEAASVAAGATLGLLVAAVVAALVLSATGTAADEGSRRATLGVLLLVAWFAGLIIAIARRVRSFSSRAGPVS